MFLWSFTGQFGSERFSIIYDSDSGNKVGFVWQ